MNNGGIQNVQWRNPFPCSRNFVRGLIHWLCLCCKDKEELPASLRVSSSSGGSSSRFESASQMGASNQTDGSRDIIFRYSMEHQANAEPSTDSSSTTESRPANDIQNETASNSERWSELDLSDKQPFRSFTERFPEYEETTTGQGEGTFTVGDETDGEGDGQISHTHRPSISRPRTRALIPSDDNRAPIDIPTPSRSRASSLSSIETIIHAPLTPSETSSIETVIHAPVISTSTAPVTRSPTQAPVDPRISWDPVSHDPLRATTPDPQSNQKLWTQMLERFPEVPRHLPGKEIEMERIPIPPRSSSRPTFAPRQPPKVPSLMALHAADMAREESSAQGIQRIERRPRTWGEIGWNPLACCFGI